MVLKYTGRGQRSLQRLEGLRVDGSPARHELTALGSRVSQVHKEQSARNELEYVNAGNESTIYIYIHVPKSQTVPYMPTIFSIH